MPGTANPLPCGWPGRSARTQARDAALAALGEQLAEAGRQYKADALAAAGDPDATTTADLRFADAVQAVDDALQTALAAIDRTYPEESNHDR